MILLKILFIVISFIGGIVVNHWIARRFFNATYDLKECEILLHGLLASIIINGTIGTYLALFKLFNLYSFATVFIVLMFLLRKDLQSTITTISDASIDWFQSICKFDLLTIFTTGLVFVFTLILLALCFIPNQNPDGWVFHFPIALSIVKNFGFIYPIIDHIHYANQPSFVSVLFAEAYLLYPHFAVSSAINVLIYLFTFISLAAVWPNARIALCLLIIIVGMNFNLVTGVPTLLTDMTRTCFSVLGLTYLALFYARRVPYYAGLSALVIGGAISTKYTELITLCIMVLVLFPQINTRNGQLLIIKCAAIIFGIACFWYLKNLILLHNPIYPFIFGHPGLSDDWMKDYLIEMTQAFDPTHRNFVRNLFTKQGWIDFIFVFWGWFFENSIVAKFSLMISIFGAFRFRQLIASMLTGTMFLFIYWYIVLFNHIRWAKPAMMLLLITASFSLLSILIRIRIERKWYCFNKIKTYFKINTIVLLFSIFITLVILIQKSITSNDNVASKRWTLTNATEPIFAALTPNGIDKYLSRSREGYSIIRFVIDNNLSGVFHPFQPGVNTFSTVYNNGIPGDWFLDNNDVITNFLSCNDFFVKSKVKYFVLRPSLTEIEMERIGSQNLKYISAVINCLKYSNSELIMEDLNGWQIYKNIVN